MSMRSEHLEPIKVLDHGYVRLIEDWGYGEDVPEKGLDGQETGIIEAARQSTQGSFRGWDTDARLLKFLFNSEPPHATPFEFAGMVIEVQAPIFVFREWHRHRTQSYNEMSARYAPLPNIAYLPDLLNVKARAEEAVRTKNRQASSEVSEPPGHDDIAAWWAGVHELYKSTEGLYQEALKMGIPKELARIILPVGRYSRMRASANLRNWLAFLTLRTDPGAQWEIRQYAEAVATIVSWRFPRVYELWEAKRER